MLKACLNRAPAVGPEPTEKTIAAMATPTETATIDRLFLDALMSLPFALLSGDNNNL